LDETVKLNLKGSVDFAEFQSIVEELMLEPEHESQLKVEFDDGDEDKKGKIKYMKAKKLIKERLQKEAKVTDKNKIIFLIKFGTVMKMNKTKCKPDEIRIL
jgi:Ca2+-binding EF-hand superfamily protein